MPDHLSCWAGERQLWTCTWGSPPKATLSLVPPAPPSAVGSQCYLVTQKKMAVFLESEKQLGCLTVCPPLLPLISKQTHIPSTLPARSPSASPLHTRPLFMMIILIRCLLHNMGMQEIMSGMNSPSRVLKRWLSLSKLSHNAQTAQVLDRHLLPGDREELAAVYFSKLQHEGQA